MSYTFADLVETAQGGRAPRLPDNLGFLLMADPGRDAAWGLYSVTCIDDEPSTVGFERAPTDLCDLLRSTEGYPPAIALARHALEKPARDDAPTRMQFAADFALTPDDLSDLASSPGCPQACNPG